MVQKICDHQVEGTVVYPVIYRALDIQKVVGNAGFLNHQQYLCKPLQRRYPWRFPICGAEESRFHPTEQGEVVGGPPSDINLGVAIVRR